MLIDAARSRCTDVDEGEGTPVAWLHGLGGAGGDAQC
jgi:hypothetical protein